MSRPDGKLCSAENRAQLFVDVCVIESEGGFQWLIWLMRICSGHGPRRTLVYELLFCAELITSDQGIHIHMVTDTHTHIEISLYENPPNLYD